jgi:hypothetical protein
MKYDANSSSLAMSNQWNLSMIAQSMSQQIIFAYLYFWHHSTVGLDMWNFMTPGYIAVLLEVHLAEPSVQYVGMRRVIW